MGANAYTIPVTLEENASEKVTLEKFSYMYLDSVVDVKSTITEANTAFLLLCNI
jgi:hypothetical protein